MKRLILIAMVVLMSSSIALAQCDMSYQNSICEGDFDYDCDVDANDVTTFLAHFGRSQYNNPCRPNGPAPVPKTGQTTSYTTEDDGDLEKGVAWPNPRFTDNSDGTVTDNLTGLTWLKDANCMVTNYPSFDNDGTAGDGRVTWQHAFDFVLEINVGIFSNCGDGNTDWRVPNRLELESLLNLEYSNLAMPNTMGTGQGTEGDPFTNVHSSNYWSSSTLYLDPGGTHNAWTVSMIYSYVNPYAKSSSFHPVWPVRGGH